MTKTAVEKLLKKVRVICLALPEATEVEAWGHPTFRVSKKMFAGFGEPVPGSPALGLKVGFDRQEELLQHERFFPTPYAAHQGWVSLKLDAATNWDEVKSLVLESYKNVAQKRLLKVLADNQQSKTKGGGC